MFYSVNIPGTAEQNRIKTGCVRANACKYARIQAVLEYRFTVSI